ncbi:MAG TPA: hypothetical protein VFR94_11350 [Nitrososphaeraceae archaeon]|nr:hypothetical protein [Nitrososphaeraceae archaeon]
MLKRIPTPEQSEIERAQKALRLTGADIHLNSPTIIIPTIKEKPIFKIKRLSKPKLEV